MILEEATHFWEGRCAQRFLLWAFCSVLETLDASTSGELRPLDDKLLARRGEGAMGEDSSKSGWCQREEDRDSEASCCPAILISAPLTVLTWLSSAKEVQPISRGVETRATVRGENTEAVCPFVLGLLLPESVL